MMRLLCAGLLLVLTLSQLTAQPDPNNPQPDPRLNMPHYILSNLDNMPVMMKAMPQGLFMLRQGVLIKYETGTTREIGRLELFGPMEEWSDEHLNDWDDGMLYLIDRTRRMQIAVMTTSEKNLLILIGSQLFCVDAETCRLRYVLTVLDPDPLMDIVRIIQLGDGMAMRATKLFIPGQVDVQGNVLSVIFNEQFVTVDIARGVILRRDEVPPALLNTMIPPPKTGAFAAKPLPADLADDQPSTLLGRVVVRREDGKDVVLLRWEDGNEFELQGLVVAKLIAEPRIADTRVLLRGTYHKHPKRSVLEVKRYLLLTTAVPQP